VGFVTLFLSSHLRRGAAFVISKQSSHHLSHVFGRRVRVRWGVELFCHHFHLSGVILHREKLVIACISGREFESLGFHSVDAGFVALVLFDFLLSSWRYSLQRILTIIINEAMEEANC
jgi:hypothetical protein